MDYDSLMKLVGEKRQAVGQRAAEIPNIIAQTRENLFGNDAALKNLQGNEKSKIDELFSHDQAVADYYRQNPLQSSDGLPLDPYIREINTSNRYRGTVGELTDIRQKAQTRRDVLGDALEKATLMLQYGLDAQKWEADHLFDQAKEARAKSESDRDFQLRKSTSGSKGDSRTQDATDKAVEALMSTLGSVEDGEDPKEVAWQWIHTYEPGFKSRGIDSAALWDIYNKLKARSTGGSPSAGLVAERLNQKPASNPLSNYLPFLKK